MAALGAGAGAAAEDPGRGGRDLRQRGVLTAAEVALSRFDGDAYSTETQLETLDRKSLEEKEPAPDPDGSEGVPLTTKPPEPG